MMPALAIISHSTTSIGHLYFFSHILLIQQICMKLCHFFTIIPLVIFAGHNFLFKFFTFDVPAVDGLYLFCEDVLLYNDLRHRSQKEKSY